MHGDPLAGCDPNGAEGPSDAAPNVLEAALAYLRRGWSVIPVCRSAANGGGCLQHGGGCGSPGKTPLIPWTEFQRRRATEAEVRVWAMRWPDMNIGIVTGAVSGLLVVDVDDAVAVAEVNALAPCGAYIPTASTPRGGRHFYFALPAGAPLRNAVGVGGMKLDLRAEGGYVVAPPSVGANGSGYEWIAEPDEAESLTQLDGDLLALLRSGAPRGAGAAPKLTPGATPGGARLHEGGRNHG
ncbi:MAG: bifunctional DNA primase/polymerase, partial [Myxococcota bacterium]|nr:bifunctional DNA primase/polymerase [Myxococcota bacterium]